MFGWKKFTQKYDFESKDTNYHNDVTESYEPSFEEVLIEKTESASINHSNVNFLKVKVTDCLCDMDDELAKLADSKLTVSKDVNVNNESKIFDAYLEKIKAIKSISLISNDEIVEARQKNESHANFRKREQEVAHANLLKHEVDGCLIDLDVELTKLIEAKLSSDSRAKFEKRSNEIVDAALAKLEQLHSIKSKAEVYLSAIYVELAKKEKSELVMHLSRTKRHRETYIYISSLSTWAKEKYNISIFEEVKAKDLTEESEDQFKQENSEDFNLGDGLSSTKAEHLYTTFAFLVEALADVKNSGYSHNDGSPNVSVIAKHLELLATAANKNKKLHGQGDEAIKIRIEKAFKTLKSKLPK